MAELFGRLRSWITSQLQGYDETHVDLDDDVVVAPIRYEFGDPSMPSLNEWRERFRPTRMVWFAPPAEVSCVFCPEPATEEIFLGWVADPKGVAAPPTARFARVCINHLGHSRFTRSDRPVDEL